MALLTLLLLMARPAAAAEPVDITAIQGRFVGEVMNGGNMDPHTTIFQFDASGRFSGSYLIEDETGVFEGTLSNLIVEGPLSFSFEWTDHDGEGLIYIDFDRSFSRFSGYWTTLDNVRQFPINGRRQ